jgi:hypothetical protein
MRNISLRRSFMRFRIALASVAWFLVAGQVCMAGAMRSLGGSNTLTAGNDGTALVDIGFTVNLWGADRTQLSVNMDGNVTFDSGMPSYLLPMDASLRQIVAPFYADVDTTDPLSGLTSWGNDTVDGHNAFGVTWRDVRYFENIIAEVDQKRNSFQLVLIDRPDTGAGNFDIEFNYDGIQWDIGAAGAFGLGGDPGLSAYAGFISGSAGPPSDFYLLPGSGLSGAFLDFDGSGPNPTGLIFNSHNSNVAGRYVYGVRGGDVREPSPTAVPEPSSVVVWVLGVLGIAAYLRRKRVCTLRNT